MYFLCVIYSYTEMQFVHFVHYNYGLLFCIMSNDIIYISNTEMKLVLPSGSYPEFRYLKNWMVCPNTMTTARWKNCFVLELYQQRCLLSIAFTSTHGQFCCIFIILFDKLHNLSKYNKHCPLGTNNSLCLESLHNLDVFFCCIYCILWLFFFVYGCTHNFLFELTAWLWSLCLVDAHLLYAFNCPRNFLLIPLFENRSHPRIHVVNSLRLPKLKLI
jgi:hypothetical protein